MLILAPMEGLLDHGLRAILTRVDGIDRCVSEFIRVTGQLLPARSFLRIVPELARGSRTAAGVPVWPQLLGSNPACLADNAARLAQLRPAGIDLNFGCPAKTVNRHGGGAVLLDDPELIHRIVTAVRRAVPHTVPLSAKMRLGYRDTAHMLDAARAIADGGACELTVHARTQAQGYRPPAHWNAIAQIRAAVPLPVIANGEIWTVADAHRCRRESGCDALMLGRGLIRNPGLALAIRQAGAPPADADAMPDADAASTPGPLTALPWPQVLPLLAAFWDQVSARIEPRHRAGRLKQWLGYLRHTYPQAQALFDTLRAVRDPREIGALLAQMQ